MQVQDVCKTHGYGCTSCSDYPVTITQTAPGTADISMELISPDTGAKYATSEDFAVTAVITNEEPNATVTIDSVGLEWYPDDAVSILESPPTPFSITAGDSETITWTLHCEGSGMVMLSGYAYGVNEICETAKTGTPPLILWQYPTAHLEVETSDYPEQVAAGETFSVTARITNTGEADATEVYATLSVTPEGSVGLAAGDQGYTKLVGTIPGHDSTANYKDVTWNLTCKQACTSTITVTASGNDEYGWHIKQESQTTGNFIIELGALTSEQLDNPYYSALPNRGWAYGVFVGDSNGLAPGPFSVDTDLSMAKMGGGPDYLGHVVGMGFVIPHVDEATAGFLEYIIEDVCGDGLDLEGKDAMFWVVHITMDSPYDLIGPWSEWCVEGGLMEVINGTITATWSKWNYDPGLGQYQDSLLGGTFNSNLAAEAGRAIEVRFIEPDSFTVKQVADADLGITKVADGSTYTVGQTATFTMTLTNYGPANATSIKVTDLLPSGVNYQSYSAWQGWYDVTSGVWDVGDLAYGNYALLVITAKVNTAGSITNQATITAADQHDPNTTNNSAVKTITGQAAPPTTTVSLAQGYNLMSLPLIPEDPTLPNLLTSLGTKVDLVAAYSPFQDWKVYTPGGGDLTAMNDGWGYWMLMNAAGTLSYDGYELVAPPPAVPPSYTLVEGWNLIGFKSTRPKPIAEYLAAISGKYTILYGYANGNYFIAGTAGHEYLQPGQGYWIAVIQPGTIYP
jgi:uncharacterized repeat protein (TIGR01451 family)